MSSVVLVTGANGFLGSQIVREALASELAVRATSRDSSCRVDGVQHHRADILVPGALTPIMSGLDCVVHAAGLAHIMDKSKAATAPFDAVNAAGTANVMRAATAAGVRHVVLVSSVSVYGDHSGRPVDEEWVCRPSGRYAESKMSAELQATEIAKQSGLALTILRFATMYGPGDPGNVGRLIRTIDKGRFFWIGSGSNRKSLIHRDDAARACVTAVIRGGATSEPQIYNVSAPPCTMRDLVDEIARCLGRRVPPLRVPGPVALAAAVVAACSPIARSRLGGLRYLVDKWLVDDVYIGSRFERDYRFKPLVYLEDGIRQQVAWYREQMRLSPSGAN